MKKVKINPDTDAFKKYLLKKCHKALMALDIEHDFLEISTIHKEIHYQVRICGIKNAKGELDWDIVRIINQSILIPFELRQLQEG